MSLEEGDTALEVSLCPQQPIWATPVPFLAPWLDPLSALSLLQAGDRLRDNTPLHTIRLMMKQLLSPRGYPRPYPPPRQRRM